VSKKLKINVYITILALALADAVSGVKNLISYKEQNK